MGLGGPYPPARPAGAGRGKRQARKKQRSAAHTGPRSSLSHITAENALGMLATARWRTCIRVIWAVEAAIVVVHCHNRAGTAAIYAIAAWLAQAVRVRIGFVKSANLLHGFTS